jgi:hypothetical protein
VDGVGLLCRVDERLRLLQLTAPRRGCNRHCRRCVDPSRIWTGLHTTTCSLFTLCRTAREGRGDRRSPAVSDRCIPESISGPDQRADKNPALGGLLHPCLWASAQETPAARCLASPGKRTRRGRRVRAVVSQRSVPWQAMTGVRRTQDSPQTDPDGCDQAPRPALSNELRVENIVVSY